MRGCRGGVRLHPAGRVARVDRAQRVPPGGIYNINASLEKSWRARAETEMRFRAESVNFLNTPQFAEPGYQLAESTFGAITNTLDDGRTFRLQLGFRF